MEGIAINNKSQFQNLILVVSAKAKDYMQLMKFTLSFMVVFSSVIAYLLAPTIVEFDWKMMILLSIAGLLVSGSANTYNQILEIDTDALMKRTAKRPLPDRRMTISEAQVFAFVSGSTGVFILYTWFTWQAALIAAISLALYAFIYTPLKKVNVVAVFVGAVPGALPCLIGWAAAYSNTNFSWTGGIVLFLMQFLWQFPHFWAIAWLAHSDYARAGFKLLPSKNGPSKNTAIHTIFYSLLMIPVGLIPFYTGISGIWGIVIVSMANLFLLGQCIRLYREMSAAAARRIMFSSYLYLPIVLLALLATKLI